MKNKLLQQRQEILNRFNHNINIATTISLDDLSDELDLAEFERNNSIVSELKNRDIRTLRNINFALHRLSIGTYNNCYDCEELIEAKRLEVLPLTTTCISCQDLRDKDGRTYVDLSTYLPETESLEPDTRVKDEELEKLVKNL